MSAIIVSHLNEAAAMLVLWELNFFLLSTLSWVAINLHNRSPRKWKRSLGLSSFYILFAQWTGYGIIARFSYNLEMKTREQNRNNKRTEIERFDWFIERIRKGVGFGWLSEGWKNFTPENFLEINRYFDLTSSSNTICHSNNVFPILGVSLAGKRRGHVLTFSSTGW